MGGFFFFLIVDEDRLSRRKSIVDTVSIQVDILPNSIPSDDVVSCWKFMTKYCLEIDVSQFERAFCPSALLEANTILNYS